MGQGDETHAGLAVCTSEQVAIPQHADKAATAKAATREALNSLGALQKLLVGEHLSVEGLGH